ncbi:MAG: hypothetical protein ACI9MB_005009, partial [Verrucomicrobiales bacterium]
CRQFLSSYAIFSVMSSILAQPDEGLLLFIDSLQLDTVTQHSQAKRNW